MPEAAVATPEAQAPTRFELPADESVVTTSDTTPAAPVVEAKPAVEVKPVPEGEKPDGEQTDKTEPDPEKRRESRRIERKIGNAYRKAAEAQARADVLEQQVKELSARQVQPAADQPAPGAPRIEDFSTVQEYATAVAKHESEQAVQKYRQGQAQEAGKAIQAKTLQAWEANVDKAADKYDDFNEVVGELKPGTPWTDAIMRSENGADVAYHLGQNIKEAERIIAMDPVSQILAIGRLSAKLATTPPTPKTASKAPPPIKPVQGVSVAEDGPSESQDMAAWIKARNKQLGR